MDVDDAYKEYLRLLAIVGNIEFPGYVFILNKLKEGFSIQVSYKEPDVMTGVLETQRGRHWYFTEGQTNGQVVQTCFKALLTSLEHRARENFLYRGKPVLQPHLDVDKIADKMPDVKTFTSKIEL